MLCGIKSRAGLRVKGCRVVGFLGLLNLYCPASCSPGVCAGEEQTEYLAGMAGDGGVGPGAGRAG